MSAHWDAAGYDALALPHERWGHGVVEALNPRPGEVVLELGAGTGRDAALVTQLAAGARVLALDANPAMLARLVRRGDRNVHPLRADLRAPRLPLRPSSVDAVFSVAALHWVPDHAGVFARVSAALRPGGRLVAECGGAGNVAEIRAAREVTGRDPGRDWTFADAASTAAALRAAGFAQVRTRLVADPAVFPDRPAAEAYLRTVVLGAFLTDEPAATRARILGAIAARLPSPRVDYVRLQCIGWRPGRRL